MRKILILIFLLQSFIFSAQNNVAIMDHLQNPATKNIADEVYLQTSKSIYETEEDLWFKGYVLDGHHFVPSERSKILFVQLIEDKTDKVVWEKKYEIEKGFVNGHILLESDLNPGVYTLSAYSSYSFNKKPKEFYAVKKLSIVKTISKQNEVTSLEKDTIVHFTSFAEGGNLVSKLQNNLAFKTVNSKGIPIAVSGVLFENNTPILNFKSTHEGMGIMSFIPDGNNKYHIELTEPKLNKTFPVAPIVSKGKILTLLNNKKDTLVFKVAQNNALNDEKVYLRLQVRGIVYSIASGILKKELMIKIPLKDIPQGIAEVTLFDKNALPIAERLVYVNLEQKLNIKTVLEKRNFKVRDQVNLKIKVTDENNEPVVAHLGLSVYDRLYKNKLDAKNIQTHYLLSTQLKGTVYNPGYYFNEENKDRKQALDLLMLTQGWRSYVWNEANIEESEKVFKPIIFDEIKGRVQLANPNSRDAVGSGEKGLMVFGSDQKNNDLIMTDSTGVFAIGPNYLKKKGSYAYVKLLTPSKPKYRLVMKDASFDEINKERLNKTIIYPLASEETKTADEPVFDDRNSINKLNEVLISKKRETAFRDKYLGKLDELAKANDDYVCVSNILNCSNHYGDSGNRKPVEGGKYFADGSGAESTRTTIVYRYPSFTEGQLLEMDNTFTVKTVYLKRIFYEAVYDAVTINDPLPDFRNTLFWKPDLITNESGEASITFFCSDINSQFIGEIEGVSGDGLLGSESFKFAVKKLQ
ncbi:hypothetical protein [Flavobacterium anhuiense]|uniref:hypothetical protein n=1 Tax=Flavobacterium anhuiense TaxID=459526 RepID=UPI003D9570CA